MMKKKAPKKMMPKKGKKHSKGFTMIELILVIVVLGILSVLALPMFTNITSSARTSARDSVLASVKTGVNLYRANLEAQGQAPAYPTTLDSVADGSYCSTTNLCFSGILQEPVTDGRWQRVSSTSYAWSTSVNGTAAVTYTYTPAAGTFQ